jgi:thiol-disulfide isomerase/thioredoxin
MNKVLVIVISVLIVVGVGWLAISNRNAPEESNRQAESERVHDFALHNYDGKIVQLADFAGKPLVINSWAAWCPFCRKELVDFAAVQKEFADEVTIIGVDRAETRDVAKNTLTNLG